jgi:hypothetical protein
MWPIAIFDKSFLESLNPDESVWLDNFFISNITPLFFIETLADLEKSMRNWKTPEEIVWQLAYKTPDSNSKCNTHHSNLLYWELLYLENLEIRWVPIISWYQKVSLWDEKWFLFKESPEERAFRRWQEWNFLDLERNIAKKWRRDLLNINLDEIHKKSQIFFPLWKAKSFLDVKKFTDFYLEWPDQKTILMYGLNLVWIPEEYHQNIFRNWIIKWKPSIKSIFPYFYYIFSIDLFFSLAIGCDLIARTRNSNKIDIAYLYYLPFCNLFVSNDHIHSKVVPLFLTWNQTFISWNELKNDLWKLDNYYSKLPQAIKEKWIISFAFFPPKEEDFLVSSLWDKYMSKSWRTNKNETNSTKKSIEMTEMLKNIDNHIIQDSKGTENNITNPDFLTLERKVLTHKGKWQRFSQEVINSWKKY